MGLPAFLRPSLVEPSRSTGEALPSLSAEVDEACSALWEKARLGWQARPDEGTAMEGEALRATFALLLEVLRGLADHPQEAMRSYVNEGLRRVLREQRATVDDDRAFALRQLEQALEHYAVTVESVASAPGVDGMIEEVVDVPNLAEAPLPYELHPLYRAHGALLMAFEAMPAASAEEFRYWARHAVERWRGVAASLGEVTALVRGAAAHVRARQAWDAWTEEDRAVEREAWKALR